MKKKKSDKKQVSNENSAEKSKNFRKRTTEQNKQSGKLHTILVFQKLLSMQKLIICPLYIVSRVHQLYFPTAKRKRLKIGFLILIKDVSQ